MALNLGTHVYTGKAKCGCIVAVVADMPDMPKETAKDVAEFIRGGYTVERVPVEDFRGGPFGCKCAKVKAEQPGLFVVPAPPATEGTDGL